MEVQFKLDVNLRARKLSCTFCKGPVHVINKDSLHYIFLKCSDCFKEQIILKTDYYGMGRFQGDMEESTIQYRDRDRVRD